jgi:two-component system LytT family response regulator
MKHYSPFESAIIHPDTLILPTCKGLEFIDTSTIVRVEAMSNYSKLFFNDGKTLVVAKVLHWFEERLTPNPSPLPGEGGRVFIRTHRTHLINKNFIRQYIHADGGKIRMHNGECIDVSKRKKSHFLKCWHSTAA